MTVTETAPPATEWLLRFERALASGDPLGASDALRKSGVNGWVRKDHYDRAVEVVDRLGPATVVRLNWADRLLAHPRRVDKELAALIVAPLATTHPRELARMAHRLARDDDWGVRETAATLLGRLLVDAWDETLPHAREWVSGPDSRLRRAVVVAAKYAARTRKSEWAEPLLDLIEPALRDHDEYVRKNLGPFAIGDQFVRSYPDATLARLRRWMLDEDENLRWNVAMAFSAASGARLAQRAPDILEFLSTDERPLVRGAVRAAQRRVRTLVA
ncbi:MAG TPA: DNA alkylation repair protein [Candidatus Limnocylindria bacterium]|nr:DNA alkylation repair protein [Candidatus Limnocylindria bacterium]